MRFETKQSIKLVAGADHRYDTPVGRVPSVTTILSIIDKPQLRKWMANMERELVIETAKNTFEKEVGTGPVDISPIEFALKVRAAVGPALAGERKRHEAADIGKRAHALIEWQLRKDLGQPVPRPESCPESEAALLAFHDWRATVSLEPIWIEQKVWSREHKYAGTLDLMANTGADHAVMETIDWKTGKGIYPEALLQAAAYIKALREMGHGTDNMRGRILRLPKAPNGLATKWESKIIPADQVEPLFEIFLHAKALWEWKDGKK